MLHYSSAVASHLSLVPEQEDLPRPKLSADVSAGVEDRAYLVALYPRFRCRVCGWRFESKDMLASHVAEHRSATGLCSSKSSRSVEELQAACFNHPAAHAQALSGRGPVISNEKEAGEGLQPSDPMSRNSHSPDLTKGLTTCAVLPVSDYSRDWFAEL